MRLKSIITTLPQLLEAGQAVFLWGPPGVGKSDAIEQIAKDQEAELRDVRMNLLDPVDLKGFPVPDTAEGIMRWLPADFLPPMKIKKAKGSGFVDNDSKGILFLDELNSALPATQAAGYQLILNRRIGEYRLPKNWSIVAAGNRDGDRGVTHKMPSPLANRLVHIDVDVNVDDWCNWAIDQSIAAELIAFIRFRPAMLHDFDASKNPRAFPSPRSWMFVNRLYERRNRMSVAEFRELITGTVGAGAAGEFNSFVEAMAEMPNIDKILIDPKSEPVPEKPAVKYAVTTALAMRANDNNFERLLTYMKRDPMTVEFQVVFVRDAARRDLKIAQCKAFRDWAIANAGVFV